MSTLPFLRFPFLPQQEILKNLDLLDVVKLSTLSTRSKTLVQVSKTFQVDNFYWDLSKNHERLYIRNGKTVLCALNWLDDRKYNHFFSTILELFPVTKFTLSMDQSFAVQTNPIFEYIRTFETLYIWNRYDTFDRIPKNDVDFLMDQLTVKHFEMCASSVEGKYRKPLKHHTLILEDLEWLSLDSILNMTTSCLSADGYMSLRDKNTVLKKWASGGLENLETFNIEHYTEDGNVLEGIETVEIDAALRPFKLEYSTRESVKEIKREDGRIASAVFANDRLKFLVWPINNCSALDLSLQ